MKKLIFMLSVIFLLSSCSRRSEVMTEEEYTYGTVFDHILPIEDVTDPETISIPETEQTTEAAKSETKPVSASDNEVKYDIFLRANKADIRVGTDDAEIIWYAEIPVDCEPEKVQLVDADTGEVVSELFDEADYEKYGDTIKGDSVYNCRFTVNTDIDTDPDVSEDRYYHYYACFTENGIIHCSETIEIWVWEPFTDKELYDMEAADTAISEFMASDVFSGLSTEEKSEQMLSLLLELSEKGTSDRPYSLIDADSIYADGDMISFQYACGVGGGVKLTPFREYMN